jgi:hypothetical protein
MLPESLRIGDPMTTEAIQDFSKMAGRKKENYARGRVEFMADPEWIARVDRQARRLGTNVSAYIRQAVTRQLERDEAEAPKTRK